MEYPHIKESKRQLACLNSERRIEIINRDFWVDFPQAATIERVIRNMLNIRGRSQAPCLLVCGAGGTGKTSLIKRIKINHESWGCRVAFTSLSENPDGLRFREQILFALGAPSRSDSSYLSKLPQGLERFIELRGYRGIIIDEFHDSLLVQKQEQRRNLSLLKTLSGEPYQLSVIGFGTTPALNALQQDKQLERRFEIIQILPWEETDDFRRFLASIEENMPVRNPSNLYSKEVVKFLLSETDGTMDEVMKIIRFGAIQAILSGEEIITIEAMKQGARSRWDY